MKTHVVHFQGALGERLAAEVDLPAGGDPLAWALFAHGSGTAADPHPGVHLSLALTRAGVGVLRMAASSSPDDLVAAARYMAEAWSAPQLLVGHSLGGAAVIRAAPALPSVRAVATIGAPADSDDGTGPLAQVVESLGRPLLVLHAPEDEVVPLAHAAKIFSAARHPKSLLALDGADHLLTDAGHSRYAARLIATWAARYLESGVNAAGAGEGVAKGAGEGAGEGVAKGAGGGGADAPRTPRAHVAADAGEVVAHTGPTGYRTGIGVRRHRFIVDEPEQLGGTDEGPTPYEMLWTSLAACTTITLRMYADRKSWPLEDVHIRIRHRKEAGKDLVVRELTLEGHLDAAQRERLVEIADRCPVHRTLERGIEVSTELV